MSKLTTIRRGRALRSREQYSFKMATKRVYILFSVAKCSGAGAFHTRGPATVNDLSPKLLYRFCFKFKSWVHYDVQMTLCATAFDSACCCHRKFSVKLTNFVRSCSKKFRHRKRTAPPLCGKANPRQ